ncbi:MAG: ribosome maturation factor RimM [Desulfobacterales bacterium]
MADPRYVLIGRITGTHGLGGRLKLRLFSESLELFAPGRSLKASRAGGAMREFEVEWVRAQGPSTLLALKGVHDRRLAEELAGWDLFVEKQALPQLEPGTYYWDELIGMDVYAVGGPRLGRLASIFRTGSNDVYVVAEAGRELLVPALSSVVTAVDLAARRMEVDLPEGLEWS